MRYLFTHCLLFPSLALAHYFPPAHKVGNICHAENANSNYGGLWELSLKGNLICNYWQFLGDESRKKIEAQLDEYGEFPIQNLNNEEIEADEFDNSWEIDDWGEPDWDSEFEDEDDRFSDE